MKTPSKWDHNRGRKHVNHDINYEEVKRIEEKFIEDLHAYERMPKNIDRKEIRGYFCSEQASYCGSPAQACEES